MWGEARASSRVLSIRPFETFGISAREIHADLHSVRPPHQPVQEPVGAVSSSTLHRLGWHLEVLAQTTRRFPRRGGPSPPDRIEIWFPSEASLFHRPPTAKLKTMTSSNSTGSVSRLPPFELERFFAKYEFSAPYSACSSDMQALSMSDLIAMADEECRQLWDNLMLKYTETLGLPLLRKEIIKQHYPSLTPDNVNVLCPQEGIFLSMNTLLAPTDHVIAVGPAYQSLTAVAESIGCELSLWKCKPDPGNSKMPLIFDVSNLEKLVRPNTKLLLVNFPHNPTGFLPTQAEWTRIVGFARKHGLFLFSDEMYHGLEHESAHQLPAACTVYEKGISLSGMSKTYGMPGVRIGWIASRDDTFMTKFATLKDYTTICNSGPSEILALIALRNRHSIVERSLGIIRENKDAVQKFMDGHSDVFAYEAPRAGPIAFPKLIGEGRTNASEYAQHLVDKFGILILPGDKYGDQAYDDRFRLSLARTNIPEILALWEKDFQSAA